MEDSETSPYYRIIYYRALKRLRHEYPERYKEILKEERAKLEVEGVSVPPKRTEEELKKLVRRAKILRNRYGRSYDEIAERLGVAHGTAWKYVNGQPRKKS